MATDATGCVRCGYENPRAARFCMACGAPLGAGANPRRRRWRHWWAVPVAVCVGSGLGMWAYLSQLQQLGQAWHDLTAVHRGLPATSPQPVADRTMAPHETTVHDPADPALTVTVPAGWAVGNSSSFSSFSSFASASFGAKAQAFLSWVRWSSNQLGWQAQGTIDWSATLNRRLAAAGVSLPADVRLQSFGPYSVSATADLGSGRMLAVRVYLPQDRQAAEGFVLEGPSEQVASALASARLPAAWSGPPPISWVSLAQQGGWDSAVGSLTVRPGLAFGMPAGKSALTGTVFQESTASGGYRLLSAGHMVLDESKGAADPRLWAYQRAVETGEVTVVRNPFRPRQTRYLAHSDAAWTDLAQPLLSGALTVGDYRQLKPGTPLILLGNNRGAMLTDGEQPVLIRATYVGLVDRGAAEAAGASWPERTLPLALALAVPDQNLEGMSGAPVITAQGTVVGIYVAGDNGQGLAVPLDPASGIPLGGTQAVAVRYDNRLDFGANLPF